MNRPPAATPPFAESSLPAGVGKERGANDEVVLAPHDGPQKGPDLGNFSNLETSEPVAIIPEMSGRDFEQTMVELGYPAWWRDDRLTRAIDAAWRECCEAGSRLPFDVAAAAKARGLPPVPTGRWV